MREKQLEKIRKLLKHAASAEAIGSAAEAEAFAARAKRALDEYNLTMDDVELHEAMNSPIEIERVETDIPVPLWQNIILSTLAQINGCVHVEQGGTQFIMIVGRAADRNIAINFFKYFRKVGRLLMEEFEATYRSGVEFFQYGEAGLPQKIESYMAGFAVGVSRNLDKAYGPRKDDGTSVDVNPHALVFLERRADDAKEWLENRAPVEERLTVEAPQMLDGNYVEMGMNAGARVALTDKILG